jgi:proline racemase
MLTTYDKIKTFNGWEPSEDWLRIKTIDMHTGGEPLRVILSGFPEVKGHTILECRNYVKEHYDHLRTALMFEPRGHADMYGLLIVPPERPDSDFGVLFMHNEGYSTMCGHATIAITKLAVELGWVEIQEPETAIKIDAPCGQLIAYATVKNGIVEHVHFECVPSFVVALDETVDVPGLGNVTYDLAYGGAFYAYVNAEKLGIDCTPENYRTLIEKGMDIKREVMAQKDNVKHPFEAELSFLYGTIFIGGPVSEGVDSRNVCIFAEGEVDRSPTGSGVSGRAAIHYKRGELKQGDEMLIESIIGTTMTTSVIETTTFGDFDAVIPKVGGMAYITGQHEFVIDPNDPLKDGFILR